MSADRHAATPRACQICGRTGKQVELVPGAVVRSLLVDRIAKTYPSWSPDGDICIDDLNRWRSD
ncbi:MAG TPA: hypothetical protein VFV80_07315 [Geminicoccaceae bacterium]|nr:hypothetical protein [Geminicoccaceae bacterium]